MLKIAEKHGFDDIMEETWFCHTPTKDGKPCGMCNPCKYTREEGLGRRGPNPSLYRRTRRFLGKVKGKLERLF